VRQHDSPARFAAEVDAGRDMLARTAERFDYRPKRVAADTAYGSAPFLAFVRGRPVANNRPSASTASSSESNRRTGWVVLWILPSMNTSLEPGTDPSPGLARRPSGLLLSSGTSAPQSLS
jgi:hypothetical protein